MISARTDRSNKHH